MILDGKKVREEILSNLKKKIDEENLKIVLGIIQVGNDDASNIYIKNKIEACKRVGISCILHQASEDANEEFVLEMIKEFNDDPDITGIILQSPVPSHINFEKCSSTILPEKDVDGFTTHNVYNLYLNKKSILPCTVKGIIRLMDYYNIDLEGKHVVIVGRGNIVGKPLGLALLNRNAIVTWTHSKTKDLASITKTADILVSATGVAHLITADMVKKDAVVIDVGISRVDGHIVGDVDFDSVSKVASYITPNPGGVGPMTVAMIMDNLVKMKLKNN